MNPSRGGLMSVRLYDKGRRGPLEEVGKGPLSGGPRFDLLL